jgi:anti-sigma factor RsiW
MSMTCEDIERFADAYVDDELDLGRTLEFETHLSTCEACTARLDRMRGVRQALRAVP